MAVAGYPADTLSFASRRRVLATTDVVVSGVNWGENLGPVIAASGTIGAARAAVRLGVPALAVSQGAGDPPTSRRVQPSPRRGCKTTASSSSRAPRPSW